MNFTENSQVPSTQLKKQHYKHLRYPFLSSLYLPSKKATLLILISSFNWPVFGLDVEEP